MQSRYNVLQSGFISLENKQLLTPQSGESDLEFDAYILNKPHKDNENLFFYHKGLQNVFNEYNEDQRVSMTLAFQEKTILEFMDALDNRTFAEWINLQNENPFLTDLHVRFIKDTVNFIAGAGRSVQTENWALIIDRKNSFGKKQASKFNIADMFDVNAENSGTTSQSFDFSPDRKYLRIPFSLADMLQWWIAKPMGFSDFIVTAEIIFGKQSAEKTVV